MHEKYISKNNPQAVSRSENPESANGGKPIVLPLIPGLITDVQDSVHEVQTLSRCFTNVKLIPKA